MNWHEEQKYFEKYCFKLMDDNLKDNRYIVAADIGGSHITAAVVDIEAKRILPGSVVRKPVNSDSSANEIITVWADIISGLFMQYPQTSKRVGMAMPGPFDYMHGISLIKGLDKYDSLYQLNIKELLADHLKIKKSDILMRNDAEAFLAGEVFCGAAAGYDRVIGITLGTGVGSARSYGGITEDANLGPGPFLDTIADDYFSTRWFIQRYSVLTGKTVKNVKELTDLLPGDNNVRIIMEEFVENLSLFLQGFFDTEQPEVVIIGGNIAKAHHFFLDELKIRMRSKLENCSLKIAALGEDAALMGASRMFIFDSMEK